MTTFGQWLKQRRKALDLTQKELAQQAGCAEVTLRKIEAGALQPSAPLVASLAAALGVPKADLPGLVALVRGLNDDFTARARLLRPQRPNNLPAQLTPLIGRERDITAVRKRLLDDGARLVTLLGPPGVGKTRLSLAVAEDVLEQFDDGVFLVRLAPVSDPDQVAAAVAQALGLQMSGPNPPELQLRAYLEEKHLLFVLDNFEHIVAAAPLVDDLLRRCPWVHVLVTSRQPLRVRGERQVTVQPLALPTIATAGSVATAEDMLRYPAVELFADRAEAVLPDFAVDAGNAATVAELCRRLDGLPLAIELVAARVKLLPPAELLGRLHGPWLLSTDGMRDVSARQKTLRGAIGWSYDLLSPDDQTLFRYLSVFVGGFTLEAAELLCGDALYPTLPLTFSPAQVLDGVASLLDKSLLHREPGLHGGTRYVMLETVREYGLERVAEKGLEMGLHKRHASCFIQLIESGERANLDPGRIQLRRLIDDDIHNVRGALAWAVKHDAQAALLLTAPLLHWYGELGPFTEGRRLLDIALTLPGASAETIPRAKALMEAGILMHYYHENALAQGFEEEALAISERVGYIKGIADALLLLGRIAMYGWFDLEEAGRYFEQSAAMYRKVVDPDGISYALMMLAEIEVLRADYPRARTLAEESYSVIQQAGFRNPYPLGILGTIAYAEGDLVRARTLHEKRLAIERQRGVVNTGTLVDLATTLTRQRDFTAAHSYLYQLLEHARGYGNDTDGIVVECHVLLARLFQMEGDHRSATRWYRASLAGVTHRRDIWRLWTLGLIDLALVLNRHELAARLLGATAVIEEAGFRLLPAERAECTRLADAVRAHLGTVCFETALAEGRAIAFEQVVQEAVSILEEVVGADEEVGPVEQHG